MTAYLRDLPAIRVGAPNRFAKGGAFDDAETVTSSEAERRARALMETSEAVVLIDQNLNPHKEIELFEVDEALLSSGAAIVLPARSAVTGLFLPCGIRVVTRASLNRPEDSHVPAEVVLPVDSGTFYGNETPQSAFTLAYELHKDRPIPQAKPEANRLALAASIGVDVLNGGWWCLGTLSAFADLPVDRAWRRYNYLFDFPGEMAGEIEASSREVRLRTGLPVQALGEDGSKAVRKLLSNWPPADMWTSFISDCNTIGGLAKSRIAPAYEQALQRVWPLGA